MPPHVVVVDDEPDIREVIALIFADTGFRVTPVASPEAARTVLSTEGADLLVTDQRLGSASDSGLDLVRFARKHLPPTVGIILLTALQHPPESEQAAWLRSVGAQVVAKPFDMDQLQELARQLTGWQGESS
jgi:DNA-binding response OmpR family regulator